ncbi:MAG: hypothetical protein ACI8WB_000980 [Phenylobacterium sp.]|jgi:hypothetical protein
MLSKVRFFARHILVLILLLSAQMVVASTWVPISYNGLTIFIPKPGLTSVEVGPFVYDQGAVLTLNDFGATTSIYYHLIVMPPWITGGSAA